MLEVTDGGIRAWNDNGFVIEREITGRKVTLRFGEIDLFRPLGFASYSRVGGLRRGNTVCWGRPGLPRTADGHGGAPRRRRESRWAGNSSKKPFVVRIQSHRNNGVKCEYY